MAGRDGARAAQAPSQSTCEDGKMNLVSTTALSATGAPGSRNDQATVAWHWHTGTDREIEKVAIRDLNFYYGTVQALTDVYLSLKERRVTALIGPSGCGKSTLIRALNRIFELY